MVSTSEAKLAEKESVAPATERAAASVEPKAMLAAASAAAIPYLDKVETPPNLAGLTPSTHDASTASGTCTPHHDICVVWGVQAADLVEKASPYCLMAFEKGKALLVKLEPYKLDVTLPRPLSSLPPNVYRFSVYPRNAI